VRADRVLPASDEAKLHRRLAFAGTVQRIGASGRSRSRLDSEPGSQAQSYLS
jgi:hypothetical protein